MYTLLSAYLGYSEKIDTSACLPACLSYLSTCLLRKYLKSELYALKITFIFFPG